MFVLTCIGLLLILLLSAFIHTPAYANTSVLRNGSFSDGLNGWMLSSEAGDWDPLTVDLSASLSPPKDGFRGTVIYQNLNVTQIQGKSFLVYLWLKKIDAWSGNTVAAYVDYLDSGGSLQRMQVLNPDNDDMHYFDWSLCTNTFTFPADAQKLVRFSLAKEDYGAFDVDGIMLLTENIVPVNNVPVIHAVNAGSGPYGSTLTIDGIHFGANSSGKGRVAIGGSNDGLNIQSWTDSRIVVTVDQPARSGRILVVADNVESDGDFSYNITSPTFSIDVLETEKQVIRGASAEFVVRARFLNGFMTENGIGFTVPEAPSGAVTFTPGPLMHHGGVLMSVDTDGLTPGVYNWHVETLDDNSAARSTPFTLKVVEVGDVEFYTHADDGTRMTVELLNLAGQQRVYIYCSATDTDGKALPDDTPVTITTDNLSLRVIPTTWGASEVYALSGVSTNLHAHFPDGSSWSLPVTCNLTGMPRVDTMNLSPTQVTNKGDQTISFNATGTEPIQVDIDYTLGTLVGYTYSWSNADKTFSGSGRVPEGILPGQYLIRAQIRANRRIERIRPLVVVNDPQRGMLKGSLHGLRSGWEGDIRGTLEFYNSSGNKVSEHRLYGWGDFTVPYVQPGIYRLRFMPDGGFDPQWYPNRYSYGAASDVEVVAGQTAEGIRFFLPDAVTNPLAVVATDPVDGAEGVPLDKHIKVVFNKPVDVSTVTSSTFRLRENNALWITGTVTCDGITATFVPSAGLSNNAFYTVGITPGVRDIYGNQLSALYNWSFTAAADTVNLAEARNLPDGTPVSVEGTALYLVQGGFGYIQELNRSAGMRIEGSISAGEGDLVTLSGTMQTTPGGERYIQIGSITATGSEIIRPVGARVRSVEESLMNGLYVTVWGQVIPGSITSESFRMNDGFGGGLLIRTPSAPGVNDGDFVMLSGAAGFDGERVIYSK